MEQNSGWTTLDWRRNILEYFPPISIFLSIDIAWCPSRDPRMLWITIAIWLSYRFFIRSIFKNILLNLCCLQRQATGKNLIHSPINSSSSTMWWMSYSKRRVIPHGCPSSESRIKIVRKITKLCRWPDASIGTTIDWKAIPFVKHSKEPEMVLA